MKLGFLFGAGASIPAGAPSTERISTVVLDRECGYSRHTDGSWYKSKNALHPQGVPTLDQIQALLHEIKDDTNKYYECRPVVRGCVARASHYEDFAFLVVQIEECLTYDRDNPALWPYVRTLCDRLNLTGEQLRETAAESLQFISDVVVTEIERATLPENHLNAVVGACRKLESVAIFTLNHDTLIEQSLRRADIDFDVGLRSKAAGYRIVNAPSSASRCPVFKLHGSIDWATVRGYPESAVSEDVIAVLDYEYLRSVGFSNSQVDPMRQFLLGRFNKELNYLSRPFRDIWCQALVCLQAQETIAVSGYSFGDKVVNTLLLDWLDQGVGRRMFVFHEDIEGLVDGARGAIQKNWDRLVDRGAITPVRQWMSSVSFEELGSIVKSK